MDIFNCQRSKRLTIVTASYDRNVKLWIGEEEANTGSGDGGDDTML